MKLFLFFLLSCLKASLAFQPNSGRSHDASMINMRWALSFPSPSALHCQLLGMNCATPTDFSFSFKGFSLRGGCTDVHCHGWGLILYEGKGIRSFHDPESCSQSPIAEFVRTHPLRTYNMIAHIRYATVGEVALENVHPFHREMWGINWSFAHNGDVPMFKLQPGEDLPIIGSCGGQQIYNPIGDTDSEKIFCSILNALNAKFQTLPSLPVLHEYLKELLNEIVSHDEEGTILNFIMGCGQHTSFAYSWPGQRPGSNVWNGLHYLVREPPFRQAALMDCDYEVDFSELAGDGDRVAVIATKPLTLNEKWVEFERNQLILFDEGKPLLAASECMEAEIAGHGLESDVLPSSTLLKEDVRRFEVSKRSIFSGDGI